MIRVKESRNVGLCNLLSSYFFIFESFLRQNGRLLRLLEWFGEGHRPTGFSDISVWNSKMRGWAWYLSIYSNVDLNFIIECRSASMALCEYTKNAHHTWGRYLPQLKRLEKLHLFPYHLLCVSSNQSMNLSLDQVWVHRIAARTWLDHWTGLSFCGVNRCVGVTSVLSWLSSQRTLFQRALIMTSLLCSKSCIYFPVEATNPPSYGSSGKSFVLFAAFLLQTHCNSINLHVHWLNLHHLPHLPCLSRPRWNAIYYISSFKCYRRFSFLIEHQLNSIPLTQPSC